MLLLSNKNAKQFSDPKTKMKYKSIKFKSFMRIEMKLSHCMAYFLNLSLITT